MKCLKCNTEIPENSKFCSSCGVAVEPQTQTTNGIAEESEIFINDEKAINSPRRNNLKDFIIGNKKYVAFLIVLLLFIIVRSLLFPPLTSEEKSQMLRNYLEEEVKRNSYVDSMKTGGSTDSEILIEVNDKLFSLSLEEQYKVLGDIFDKVYSIKYIDEMKVGKKGNKLYVYSISALDFNLLNIDETIDRKNINWDDINVDMKTVLTDQQTEEYTSTSTTSNSTPTTSINKEVSNLSSGVKTDAWVMAQMYIEENLKSPSSADFPWYDESFISESGGKIVVSAWVEAENSFGATLKSPFVVIMDRNYNLLSIAID